MKANEEMIGVKEIAQLIGVSKETIYSDIKKGKMPFPIYQVTATRNVARKVDVLNWLESVKKTSA